jgi:hypothetical protein
LQRLVGEAEHVLHLLGGDADRLALAAAGQIGVADRLVEDRQPSRAEPSAAAATMASASSSASTPSSLQTWAK